MDGLTPIKLLNMIPVLFFFLVNDPSFLGLMNHRQYEFKDSVSYLLLVSSEASYVHI